MPRHNESALAQQGQLIMPGVYSRGTRGYVLFTA